MIRISNIKTYEDISDEEVFCYMIEYVLNEFLCNT